MGLSSSKWRITLFTLLKQIIEYYQIDKISLSVTCSQVPFAENVVRAYRTGMVNQNFLKTFMHLVKTKSFNKTASDLNMTQPGVSQHLKALEDYYQVQLVVRNGKQFLITDAGKSSEIMLKSFLPANYQCVNR